MRLVQDALISHVGSSLEWARVRLKFNPLMLFDAEVFLISMETPSILGIVSAAVGFSLLDPRVCGNDATDDVLCRIICFEH